MNIVEKLRELTVKYEYENEFDPFILQEEVKNWPLVEEMEWDDDEEEEVGTGSFEQLDLENWYITELGNDYFVIYCGGDWQDPRKVIVELKDGELKVKSCEIATDWGRSEELNIEKVLFGNV